MNALTDFVLHSLLDTSVISFSLVRGRSVVLTAASAEEKEDGCTVHFVPPDKNGEAIITVRSSGDSAVLSIVARRNVPNGSAAGFLPENAVSLRYGALKPDAVVANTHNGPWWMLPGFLHELKDVPVQTQGLLMKVGGHHVHVLPLTGDNFRCELDGTGLRLTSDTAGLYALNGAFLAVSWDPDPYEAIRKNYAYAREVGAIRVPLLAEKPVRDPMWSRFGYCTWNSFYRDVTEEKLLRKLDEFRAKKVPVGWALLDDGWMTTRDGAFLSAFEEDKNKFPRGLKACVKTIKEEYGIPYVGVWHAFSGYWRGIDRDSALFESQKENLTVTPSGLAVPSVDPDLAFRFWDTWHSYLADCGIDFVKVDNQSSQTSHLVGIGATAENVRHAHDALERSVEKNFAGRIINCMGMDMENVLARRTAVSRNSDDFFPNREKGFRKHLIQNVYNALWHGQQYVCDFDMWWSKHESAVQSAVLRHVSGSPVYVSDAQDGTCRSTILLALDDDGISVRSWDGFAVPTPDCIYEDCRAGRLLKVWNRRGNDFALAVFNVSDETLTEYIRPTEVPGVPPKTALSVREKVAGWRYTLDSSAKIPVTLSPDGVAYFLFSMQ